MRKNGGGLRKEGRHQSALFYADNDMVALSYPRWLQGVFNTLVDLFDRVGLRKTFGKTVGMVCHPCQATGNLSEAVFGRRVTGVGPTYRDQLKVKVAYGTCGELLAAGSLLSHIMTQHRRAAEIRRQWSTPAAGIGPQTYSMSFLSKGGPRKRPVAGCPGRVATRMAIRVHFVHRHVLDTVVILEEGNFPHPPCA